MHISYISLYAHTEYEYVYKYLGIYADIHMCICIYIFYMHVWIYMLMYANICAWILPSPPIWMWSPKFFSKTFKFSIYFTVCAGVGSISKSMQTPEKKIQLVENHANIRNLPQPFLRSRKEENFSGMVIWTMPEEFFKKTIHCQGVAAFGRKSLMFKRISMRISLWRRG